MIRGLRVSGFRVQGTQAMLRCNFLVCLSVAAEGLWGLGFKDLANPTLRFIGFVFRRVTRRIR